MPTRVHRHPTQERKAIISDLLDDAEKDAHLVAADIEIFLRQQFERTFAHWGDSGRNKFNRPSVKITKKITRSNTKGITILLQCLVTDGGGAAPHILWHWLSFGTKDIVAKKNLVFQARAANRTFVRDLDAQPFPGWGSWVTIKKGKVRKGIQAREWYEAVVDELKEHEDKLLENKSYKTYYKVEKFEVKKP